MSKNRWHFNCNTMSALFTFAGNFTQQIATVSLSLCTLIVCMPIDWRAKRVPAQLTLCGRGRITRLTCLASLSSVFKWQSVCIPSLSAGMLGSSVSSTL